MGLWIADASTASPMYLATKHRKWNSNRHGNPDLLQCSARRLNLVAHPLRLRYCEQPQILKEKVEGKKLARRGRVEPTETNSRATKPISVPDRHPRPGH